MEAVAIPVKRTNLRVERLGVLVDSISNLSISLEEIDLVMLRNIFLSFGCWLITDLC